MILGHGSHGDRVEAWADTLGALADMHRQRRSVAQAGSLAHGSEVPVVEVIEQPSSCGFGVVDFEALLEAIAVEPARHRKG